MFSYVPVARPKLTEGTFENGPLLFISYSKDLEGWGDRWGDTRRMDCDP